MCHDTRRVLTRRGSGDANVFFRQSGTQTLRIRYSKLFS
jgi:hypothetical protein